MKWISLSWGPSVLNWVGPINGKFWNTLFQPIYFLKEQSLLFHSSWHHQPTQILNGRKDFELYLNTCSANFLFSTDYKESTSAQLLKQLPSSPELGKSTSYQYRSASLASPNTSAQKLMNHQGINSFFLSSMPPLQKNVPGKEILISSSTHSCGFGLPCSSAALGASG